MSKISPSLGLSRRPIGKILEGKLIYRPVSQVAPDTEAKSHIFFFSPNKEPAEGYEVFTMVDSRETYPNESIVFFNTTRATFKGILGEERITLSPGASRPIKVDNWFESPAPIALVVDDGEEKLHKVLMNKLRFAPDRRTLMILRPPARPGSLRLRAQRLTEYTGPLASGDEDSGT